MPNDQAIENEVNSFIQSQESFTSVDVQISTVKNGNWVRNHDVSKWLRANMRNYSSYEKTLIPTDDRKRTFLYYPSFADSDNYKKRNQKAITLDEFNRKYLKPSVSNRVSMIASNSTSNTSSVSSTVAQNSSNGNGLKLSISHGRIRIPASLVKQLNLSKGDSVDISSFKLMNFVSANLIVEKDGRISLPSKCVNSQVYAKVSFENNLIKVQDA